MFLFLIEVFVLKTSGLNVTITYSFSLPLELGVATPSTENCCPFGILHSNDTQGMVPPLVLGLGTQKGGTTTLHKYFNRNPLFDAPLWKELQFLASSKRNTTYQKYLTFWKSNRARNKATIEKPEFQDSKDSKTLFEVTPNYIMVWFLALIFLIPCNSSFLSVLVERSITFLQRNLSLFYESQLNELTPVFCSLNGSIVPDQTTHFPSGKSEASST